MIYYKLYCDAIKIIEKVLLEKRWKERHFFSFVDFIIGYDDTKRFATILKEELRPLFSQYLDSKTLYISSKNLNIKKSKLSIIKAEAVLFTNDSVELCYDFPQMMNFTHPSKLKKSQIQSMATEIVHEYVHYIQYCKRTVNNTIVGKIHKNHSEYFSYGNEIQAWALETAIDFTESNLENIFNKSFNELKLISDKFREYYYQKSNNLITQKVFNRYLRHVYKFYKEITEFKKI